MALRHLAPGGRVGEAVGEAELGSQQFVHRADDVGDHRARGVEDATLHPLLGVVLLEEELVEVDDRVFLRVPVAEVPDDGLHVGVVEQLDDLADAQLVEVDARPAALPRRPPTLRKVSISSRRNGLVRMWAAKSSAVFLCGSAMRAESRP